MKREDSLSWLSGRILKWLLSVGILNLQAVHDRRNSMSLLAMVLVGCCVLVLGVMMLWLTPVTTSPPRVVKPIDSSILGHAAESSAGQLSSRTDRPDTIDSREK